MSTHADADAHALTTDEVALQVLERAHATHADTRRLVEKMGEQAEPAQLHTLRFTAARTHRHAVGKGRSIGVLNPTPIVVYIGAGGAAAAPNSEAVPVPPKSLLVLPITAEQAEFGVDPADVAASDAVVFVLLFPTVQPASLGSFV